MTAAAVGIEGFMVSIVRCRVLCRAFWVSGCLFLILCLKNPETQKQDWKKTYLFLVTDCSDGYLASRPASLNLITYVTMYNKNATVYLLCCLCLCIPSFGVFPVFPVSRPIPALYAKISVFFANIPCCLGFYTWYSAWCTQGGGVHVWLGGVCSLVRGVTRACSLTCQPDPQFGVPVRLPFPQGAGEPSSADHP